MSKTYIFWCVFLILSACQKSNKPPHPCTLGNGNCSHSQGDIVGTWVLEASRGYAAPNNMDHDWVSADCSNLVTIEFTNDSAFYLQ